MVYILTFIAVFARGVPGTVAGIRHCVAAAPSSVEAGIQHPAQRLLILAESRIWTQINRGTFV